MKRTQMQPSPPRRPSASLSSPTEPILVSREESAAAGRCEALPTAMITSPPRSPAFAASDVGKRRCRLQTHARGPAEETAGNEGHHGAAEIGRADLAAANDLVDERLGLCGCRRRRRYRTSHPH